MDAPPVRRADWTSSAPRGRRIRLFFELRAVLVAAAVALSDGCGGIRSAASPEPLDIEIVAAERLNPDERGRSLPTSIQVLQLASAAKLRDLDAEQVCQRAPEALGSDVLQSEEVTLAPGARFRRRFEREASARVLALVATFRRTTGDSCRAVAELSPGSGDPGFRFALDGYRIERR